MNFELIDNCFQVLLLGSSAFLSAIYAFLKWDKRLVVLSLAYACFTMGTAYWVLHIAITGDIPHISYVSEISWLASYFSYLSLQIMRMGEERLRFFIPAVLGAAFVAFKVFFFHMYGPYLLAMVIFAGTMATLCYVTIIRLSHGKWFDRAMLLCIALQLCVYAFSAFVKDYTRFNSYYAVDILLTLTFVSLLPFLLREGNE